jgi:hypothetical protein
MEILCRNLLSSRLDFELLSPTKLSQEEASTKVRCARGWDRRRDGLDIGHGQWQCNLIEVREEPASE